ncbi:MAG: type II secretion system GspH family protein [Pseudomonadaceae bacterium]|uniref:pilin n=1 Tax=Pseudomonas sp. Ga0074129 TaxID=1752219 RepID=UPI000A8A1C3D|nr:type II secretion system protein [Pseudomonas sp. Ga0074129]MBX9763726.1 type II secretion system GspH family protein [Pseudomonadaceae bacterium]
MNKQQSGFTLIELIMVIVILGVLAAFALPRFADFSNEARAASMNGIAGSVRSASAISRAAFLAEGDSAATTVEIEGVDIALANGYPAATAAGITAAAQVGGVTATPGTGAITYTVTGYTGTNCSVVYTAATASAPPTIVATTDGC